MITPQVLLAMHLVTQTGNMIAQNKGDYLLRNPTLLKVDWSIRIKQQSFQVKYDIC